MHSLSRFFLFLILSGGCGGLWAGKFSTLVPADSFLYVESHDLPGIRQRLSQTAAYQKLQTLDWKEIVLQLYQIGLVNIDEGDVNSDPMPAEELRTLLSGMEARWQELTSYLNGDIAFSMGNFREVVSLFRINEKVRDTLAMTYEDLPENGEFSEAQLAEQAQQVEAEAKLDAQEIGSILGQFSIWADVKNGEALENKLNGWLTELLKPEEGKEADPDLSVVKTLSGDTNLYQLGAADDATLPHLNWAIKNGVLIITFNRDALQKSLNLLETPPADSLATRPTFKEARAFVGASDALLYWDFAPLDPLIREIIKDLPAPDAEAIPFVGKLPTADAVLNWLELDALLPYVLGARLENNEVHSRGRYGFSRECALSRIFIDPEEGKAEVPGFIHKNFGHFVSSNWNLGNGWSRLETELMGIAPQAAAGMGLGRLLASGQVGFDLKLQFMDQLNGKMLMVQTFDSEVISKVLEAGKNGDSAAIMQLQMENPTGGQNHLIALGMKNEEAIHDAFDRLMTRFHPDGPPEPVLFEGHKLYYPVPEQISGGKYKKLISYCYLDGYFLLAIGEDQLLKDAVLASGDSSLQLANDPSFTALQQKVSANPSSIDYTNGAQQKKTMQMLQASLNMLKTDKPDGKVPDLSVLGDLLRQSITVEVRKGLVFEVDGLAELSSKNE